MASNLARATTTIECRRCGQPFDTEVLASAFGSLPMRCYCDRCFDMALSDFHAEERRREQMARRSLWLEEVGRDAFTDTDPTKLPAPDRFRRVMAWQQGPKGLVLHGPSGRGKSRCLWALLERLFVEDAVQVRCIRVTAFARAMSDHDRNFAEGLLRSLIRVPVLALDDVGKEPATERWEASLIELLDARTVAKRPVLVTTNYAGDKLVTRFRDPNTGEAVVRRLREFCDPVAFL